MPVGFDPQASALDAATGTLYATAAPEAGPGSVDAVNVSSCDGRHTAGCRGYAPSTFVGVSPVGIAVNQATDTIYVANAGSNTVSVINGALCNARTTAGCARSWPTIMTNWTDKTLSMINMVHCNAADSSGCSQTPKIAG